MSSQETGLAENFICDAENYEQGLSIKEQVALKCLKGIKCGSLMIEFPSGAKRSCDGPGPGPNAAIHIKSDRVITALALRGDIGLAESYFTNDWETPDLQTLLLFGAANIDALDGVFSAAGIHAVWNKVRHFFRANTRRGSRKNITFHYDLGNDFYEYWLDTTMSYSSAVFEDFSESLEDAQARKNNRLLDALKVANGDRVLEVGCGWGGFAEMALRRYGCHLTGLTLSREQAAFARARLAFAGSRADIRLQDYRDLSGQFDAIASVEMFEAVGKANWSKYFERIFSCLKPGGRAAIQVITIDPSRYAVYEERPDFIQKYIFPGGMLPSADIFEKTAGLAGFEIVDAFFFGQSYAETVRRWRGQFLQKWDEISTLGFDEKFRRLWYYYLAYCEAGFRAGTINVAQYVLVKPSMRP